MEKRKETLVIDNLVFTKSRVTQQESPSTESATFAYKPAFLREHLLPRMLLGLIAQNRAQRHLEVF